MKNSEISPHQTQSPLNNGPYTSLLHIVIQIPTGNLTPSSSNHHSNPYQLPSPQPQSSSPSHHQSTMTSALDTLVKTTSTTTDPLLSSLTRTHPIKNRTPLLMPSNHLIILLALARFQDSSSTMKKKSHKVSTPTKTVFWVRL